MIPQFWRRHFILAEGVLAILFTIGFAVWFWHFGGTAITSALLKDNRATLYGTMASIFGSLLGFVITATSIVLGFSGSDSLAVVRESSQYPMLWRTFSATIRALAGATLIALLCLLVDRDSAPVPWLVVLLVLATACSLLRIARTIWVLEHMISLVTTRTKSGP
jgi:mannose/fructose/N-acetylgalactosamine-specific phosphotransferase system component IID